VHERRQHEAARGRRHAARDRDERAEVGDGYDEQEDEADERGADGRREATEPSAERTYGLMNIISKCLMSIMPVSEHLLLNTAPAGETAD
jgi:hypothetical protein